MNKSFKKTGFTFASYKWNVGYSVHIWTTLYFLVVHINREMDSTLKGK